MWQGKDQGTTRAGATMTFTLDQFVYALPKAWREETREPDFAGRPIVEGQCTTSSLLVRRHLGGDIIRCSVGGETWRGTVHYFNELPNGMWLDTTRPQFEARSPVRLIQKNPQQRLYMFKNTMEQVDILEFWVQEVLDDHS